MKKFYIIFTILCCLFSCKKTQQDELTVGVTIPNAFKPADKDGINHSTANCWDGSPDCNSDFKVFIKNPNNIELDFSMIIYNKNGKSLFTTSDPNGSWNGTEKNLSMVFCPKGNYHYFVTVKEVASGNSKSYEGDIALLR